MKNSQRLLLTTATASTTLFSFVFLLTHSIIIGIAFAILSGAISWTLLHKESVKNESELVEAWPEVIDHLMSGISSGLSLSESLSGLAARGPEILRPIFTTFRNELYKSGDFTIALTKLKTEFSHHSSDQIFEALLIAKELGGSELLQILRTLGDFLRQDLVLRREIEVKHGWIKNSAHLSAAAPWLLLLLLSTQPTTAAAYATPTGILILASGLVMTAIAYLWMNRLGQLPQTPRVFK
jgi:tight adherence protein B